MVEKAASRLQLLLLPSEFPQSLLTALEACKTGASVKIFTASKWNTGFFPRVQSEILTVWHGARDEPEFIPMRCAIGMK
jgi:hypothetical protein